MLLFILLILGEPTRPMTEMQGDCSNFSWDMSRELQLMSGDSDPSSFKGSFTPGHKQDLKLNPMTEVTYPVTPPKGKKRFVGHFGGSWPLIINSSGVYRISLDKKIWLDVVDTQTGTALEAHQFEMQTGCDRIFKVVTYSLEKGGQYALQLAFVKDPKASVLVTKHLTP